MNRFLKTCVFILLATSFHLERADTSHAAEVPIDPPRKVKVLFATNCSWCHDGYGTEAGKGPKLAGTPRSEDAIRDIILNGVSGRMPGFKGTLSEERVDLLVEHIMNLPAE
jgi:mono/diheme cytochrome c family protein